jgi:hypothetical protein
MHNKPGRPAYLSNLINNWYWTCIEDMNDPEQNTAFVYHLGTGYQATFSMLGGEFYGLAIRPGDVGAPTVPVPAAFWLLGSGLIGLIGLRRRFKK